MRLRGTYWTSSSDAPTIKSHALDAVVEKPKKKSTKTLSAQVIRRGIEVLVLLFLFFQIHNYVSKQQDLTCNGFQFYRDPYHHEGLPQLVEVFTADNSVYFLALNKGICDPEWGDGAQLFSGHTFACIFPNNITVESDPVPPVNDWDIFTQAIMMIRCPIPMELDSKLIPLPHDKTTRLTVTLRATVDLEFNRTSPPQVGWKSPSVSHLGEYGNLPVCPREWPDQLGIRPFPSSSSNSHKKRMLTMVTQILMEYETFEAHDRIRIQIPPDQIITWLEYHLRIGFEHFYIFDNDPKEHGPLERLLVPYIQQGLVTYEWYPFQDCVRKSNDDLDGSRMTISQALSSTAAIRRYAHQTEFMGHFDVDEFVQLPNGTSDIKTLLTKIPPNVSTLVHPQEWFHDCHHLGTTASNQQPAKRDDAAAAASLSLLDKVYCVSPDSTPIKSIMRTQDVLAFFVHAPWVKTNYQLVEWDRDTVQMEGLKIAHMRQRRARDGLPIQTIGASPRPLIMLDNNDLKTSLQETIQKRLYNFHHSVQY